MKWFQGTISNWGIVWHEPNQFFIIVGESDKSTDEEHFIRTSGVVALTENMVETRNSVYLLRNPNQPAAQKAFNLRYDIKP